MDKANSTQKARQLLLDVTTLRLLPIDVTAKLETKINKFLKIPEIVKRINKKEQWEMTSDATNIAQFCGLVWEHYYCRPVLKEEKAPAGPGYRTRESS